MELTKLKLVTIIADDSLEHLIEDEIIALGAKGYTVSRVEGRGHTGPRDSAWSGENVKIETIVSEKSAEQILSAISKQYFEKYAVIVYTSDIEVLRPGHF